LIGSPAILRYVPGLWLAFGSRNLFARNRLNVIRMEITMTEIKKSVRATNTGFGSGNQTGPSAVDVEREPMPDQASEEGSDKNTIPPVRLGQGAAVEKPTEGDPDHDNPIHHTGHMPPPVTANRD
jgi:hypothetical protein